LSFSAIGFCGDSQIKGIQPAVILPFWSQISAWHKQAGKPLVPETCG
jgi:hypothetical protein